MDRLFAPILYFGGKVPLFKASSCKHVYNKQNIFKTICNKYGISICITALIQFQEDINTTHFSECLEIAILYISSSSEKKINILSLSLKAKKQNTVESNFFLSDCSKRRDV